MTAPAAWEALDRELDRWGEAGRRLPFWWRDDDAVAPTAALDRLLDVLDGRPLGLAVIPARAADALAVRLAAVPSVAVLQHGHRHADHASPGAKRAELGPGRPLAALEADVAAGRAALAARFGARALPVLVPPWNRIDPALVAALPRLGIRGLSTERERPVPPGLRQASAGVDPVAWREGGGFAGEAAAIERLVRESEAVRAGKMAGPVGLLTHHLVCDAAGWAFLARLARRMATHPAVAWRHPLDLFGLAVPAAGRDAA